MRSAARLWSIRVLTALGGVALLLFATGLVLDYRALDRTSGGYDPPYTGWSGTPIDWEAADRTAEGFRLNGRVLDYRLDCTSGMITFVVYGVSSNYRVLSERAIAVHRPREACAEHGFEPEF